MALIPRQLLIASARFGPRLSAMAVAEAIARGLEDAGQPAPDLCPMEGAGPDGRARSGGPADIAGAGAVADALAAAGFDERMRRARAVVVAVPELRERALAGTLAFEIATRARQGGVPAYAVSARNALDPFDARILDLQMVLEACGAAGLAAAGRKLGALSLPTGR